MLKKLYRKYLIDKKLFRIFGKLIYYKKEWNLSWIDFIKNKSLLYFIFEIKKETMPLPFYLQVEPTTKCNLKCEFCTRKTMSKDRLNKDIDLNLLEKIFKENKNIKVVKLQGMGEPTISSNFEEILKFLKSKNVYLSTIINGTTLNSEKVRKLLLQYFDHIIISVDSIQKEKYEQIRKGAKFDNVVEGIKKLVKDNKKYKKKISINYVMSHLNYKEIPKTIDFFEKLGIPVGFVEVQNWKTPIDSEFFDEHNFVMQERIIREKIYNYIQQNLKEEYKEKYNFSFLMKSYHLKGKCNWGFYMCFITFDGLITPCCIRMEEKYALGSLKEKSFSDIWNNKNFKKFRKAHLKRIYYPLCEYCPD